MRPAVVSLHVSRHSRGTNLYNMLHARCIASGNK